VMIALAIVSIAMVGLIRLQIISINMLKTSEVTTAGTLLAQEKIAEKLAEGYPKKGSSHGTVEKNERQFNWTVNVTDEKFYELRKFEAGNLRKVAVEINWDKSNKQDKLRMVTYVVDRNLK